MLLNIHFGIEYNEDNTIDDISVHEVDITEAGLVANLSPKGFMQRYGRLAWDMLVDEVKEELTRIGIGG